MIKKLIYLSNARLPTEKAHGYQIMKMCEAFASQGMNICLLHPYRKQPRHLQGIDPFEYYDVKNRFRIRTLVSFDLRMLLYRRWPKAWFGILTVSNAISAFIASLPAWRDQRTIFYSRDPLTILCLLRFRALIKGPLVYEAHAALGRKLQRFVDQFNKLDALIGLTKSLKEEFIQAGVRHEIIKVEPDAVDLEKYNFRENKEECCNKLGVSCDRPVVGYLGRFQTMGEEKGIPDLIEALGHVNASGVVDARLLCVGGPLDHLDAYSSIAEKAGVRPEQIRFVDRVPNAEVPYWINTFSIAVLPFPYTEHYAFYMSPLKMFEYMASGKPILATDLPSIREVLVHDHNAWLVEPDNPQALAAGIEKLLKEPGLAARIAAQAREDVEQYTWRARAERILEFVNPRNHSIQSLR